MSDLEVSGTIAGVREALEDHRGAGRTIGLVPTMGYLHDGHRSLIERSARERETTVVSIFVNPLQFGAGEDLDAYPRDIERDLEIASAAGADLVFAPPVSEMYPGPIRTTVCVRGVSETLEGASRPGHFDGVTTVVTKLFSIVGPCHAYFGEKDYQQLAVVRRMAADLDLPVEVVACPTVREADGLAMSSRNVYLTPAQRAAAPVLHRALLAGVEAIEGGERDPGAVRALMRRTIESEPEASVDYVAVVDAGTFEVPDPLQGGLRLLVAVRFGSTRLIDNTGVTA